MSPIDLNGKAALVTGGSRGIGAAIARRLAADGASVALTYVNGEEQARAVVGEIQAAGGRAIALKADNRDAAAIQAAVSETVKAFGRLDILVNSAGIWRTAPIDTLPLADFDETMEVNVRAPFVASKAAAVHMGEAAGSSRSAAIWPSVSLTPASAPTRPARRHWSA